MVQVTALLEELKTAAARPLLSRCQLGSLADRIRCSPFEMAASSTDMPARH